MLQKDFIFFRRFQAFICNFGGFTVNSLVDSRQLAKKISQYFLTACFSDKS